MIPLKYQAFIKSIRKESGFLYVSLYTKWVYSPHNTRFNKEIVILNVKLPDFSHVEQALYRIDATYSAAEVHGAACGALALNQSTELGMWLSLVLSEGDWGDEHYQEAHDLLTQVFNAAKQQLNTDGLSLALFIPDDNETMEERFSGVQKWCQGMALGVAASGIKSLDDLPEASREWFEDAVKIGSSGEVALDEDDESEEAFSEIYEFLSVGILMMTEEMQPIIGQPQLEEQTTIH